MKAHELLPTPTGDHECARCEVTIAPRALDTFALSCPASDCASPNNPNRGCLFIRAVEVGARCIFCGRTGGMAIARDDFSDLDDELLEV